MTGTFTPEGRVCTLCGNFKTWDNFSVQRNGVSPHGRISRCRDCYNARSAQSRRDRKRAVIEIYGGKCACCGELELDFLQIDHIENNGAEHRRQMGNDGRYIYLWLRRNDYPDGFQVLCANCNWGKHANKGVCPHARERTGDEQPDMDY